MNSCKYFDAWNISSTPIVDRPFLSSISKTFWIVQSLSVLLSKVSVPTIETVEFGITTKSGRFLGLKKRVSSGLTLKISLEGVAKII